MELINQDEFNGRKIELSKKLLNTVFIYPTDTIYGLGCNATNKDLINQVRELKGRYQRPFSVIAPSKKWILDNCEVDKNAQEWINKLPGPYTLILKVKHKNSVADNINPGLNTVGVRMPNNWFAKVVEDLDVPIITTSVNIVGEPFMTSLDDLDSNIKKGVNFIFYTGEISGTPSKLVFLDKPEVKVQER
jgi:L-threonylcarbamoyladenylate synthase